MVIDERLPYAPYPAPAGTAVAAPGGGVGPWFLARANLGVLIDLLREDGRTVIGPTVVDGAVTLAEVRSVDELRGRNLVGASTFAKLRDLVVVR